VIIETPGSGGYGLADERSKESIAADERSGLFSTDYMRKHYGSAREGTDT